MTSFDVLSLLPWPQTECAGDSLFPAYDMVHFWRYTMTRYLYRHVQSGQAPVYRETVETGQVCVHFAANYKVSDLKGAGTCLTDLDSDLISCDALRLVHDALHSGQDTVSGDEVDVWLIFEAHSCHSLWQLVYCLDLQPDWHFGAGSFASWKDWTLGKVLQQAGLANVALTPRR